MDFYLRPFKRDFIEETEGNCMMSFSLILPQNLPSILF